ncbi:hypothetical protein TWF481_004872 [Arthrobotrys musiformis]|uniref:Uncharacterized protein n=1 Tax=Arthrobotrys musiformis TaxID=47236 RepID=A0AAV9WL20_9PEZI
MVPPRDALQDLRISLKVLYFEERDLVYKLEPSLYLPISFLQSTPRHFSNTAIQSSNSQPRAILYKSIKPTKSLKPILQKNLKMVGFIRIANETSSPIHVFVSKYNGGSDDWFTLQPGGSDIWNRKEGSGGGWELVAFRDGDDTQRVGRYVKVNSSIIFRSWEEVAIY